MQTFHDFLRLGLVQASHPQDLDLDKGAYTFYAGFDPTSDSLHVGHLFVLITMKKLQKLGHKPIAVVGGATGMIGDPSGKSSERKLLSEDEIRHNSEAVGNQIRRFIDPDSGALVLNNLDWVGELSLIPFLRDIGKSFRVTEMLAKDSVQSRIQSEEGISYTEFTYQILQSYDFFHLHTKHGCDLQIGGSDQWGNISAGISYVRKQTGDEVLGLTLPLIESSPGQKFGKSEGRNIWLDAQKSSAYDFYQFWIQTTDEMVIPYLGFFTELSAIEIEDLKNQTRENPESRTAQKRLAYETTLLVHGAGGVDKAIQASSVLFGGSPEGLSDTDLMQIFQDVPNCKFPSSILEGSGLSLLQALCDLELSKSKGQARNLVKQGGVYVNNVRVTDDTFLLKKDSLASETIIILRSGKKKYGLLCFEATTEAG
jgi:tyrosyl-tRNA synthetase